MMRAKWGLVPALAAGLIVMLVLGIVAGGAAAPAAPDASAIETRIKSLEGLIPDQAHIMADVGEHFANLWFAGTSENWPLADFYLAETKSHLRWAVRRIPIRKDNQGREIKLAFILEAFENSQLTPLKATIDRKDKDGFTKLYRDCLTTCYSCHKAADKPFIRPRVPAEPPTPIINFDPKADWPL